MTATVHINQVSHTFGGFTALDNIDLTIDAGSFAVLLGPSGCGKTTLLSVLGGFLHPTSGTVHLDGADVTAVPPARRATTTMFQDYALFPHMNLQDNVGFGLRMKGFSKKQRNNKSAELLTLVGLDDSLRKKPHEISGGQRQRVALARALAVDPEVLLLDEPLGALDLKLRRQMQDELKAIQKRIGTTFIHVTHDQEEAMTLATRIAVMDEGRFVQVGSPAEIYETPCSRFVASFIGSANMIEGSVIEVNGETVVVEGEGGNNRFEVNHSEPVSVGDSVCLAIRPEKIDIALVTDQAATGSQNRLSGTIKELAYLGGTSILRVETEGGRVFEVTSPNRLRSVSGKHVFDWDDAVTMSFPASNAILLTS